MNLDGLIAHWRDRAAREARQSIADAYLECAADLEKVTAPYQALPASAQNFKPKVRRKP